MFHVSLTVHIEQGSDAYILLGFLFSLLVNASRGGIIDEDAAFQALQSGKLGGLGLDAFGTEPPVYSPLFELHNVVVTPHTGAHTREATEHMAEAAIKNTIDVLSGKRCHNVVNETYKA